MARSSDLSREMELLKGLGKGDLQVGVGVYAGVLFVDLVIGRIVRQHPDVRPRIANDNWTNLLPLLRRRELDLAVIDVRTIVADRQYHITPLTRRQAYAAVRPGHPLLKQQGMLSMSDVLHYPFVAISRFPPGLLRQFISESAEGETPARAGLKSFPSIACDSVPMIKKIVQISDAVTIAPLNMLLPDIEAKSLVLLPLFLPMMQTDFGIVRLARRSLSPLGALFVSTVVEVDAEVADLEEKAAKRLFVAHNDHRSAHASRRS